MITTATTAVDEMKRKQRLVFAAFISACTTASIKSNWKPGTIVGGGTLYSETGLTELLLLVRLRSESHLSFEPKPLFLLNLTGGNLDKVLVLSTSAVLLAQ